MKYIRLLKMDLRYCKKRILIGLGISVILVLFLCGGYETSVRFGIRQQGISSTGSVMNVLAYLLAGTEYIPLTEIRIPELPLRWCIIYVYGLYLLSDFPFRMKEKIGSAQILALRSQTGWWLEKLFWTFLVATGYLITVTLTIILFCVWRDIPLSLKMNQEVFAWMYPSIQGTVPTDFFWIFGLIISPAITFFILILLQTATAQLLGPVGGFCMSVSQIAAAMVYPSVLLIANQGMLFRDQSLIKTGVNRKEGLMVLAGVGIISLLLWGLAVRVKENLPKEREDI